MNEPIRGVYTLVLENPNPLPGERRITRRVLVQDFANPRMHVRHRIEMLLLEVRRIANFRRPNEYGAWRGQWEVSEGDWKLLLHYWDVRGLHEVQCGKLFGYPVLHR